jgi:hypothetical protein
MPRAPLMLMMTALLPGMIGCSSVKTTETGRTAREQLLLSTAADRAWERLEPDPLRGRKVFVDAALLDCVDKGYVVGTLRDRLCSAGVFLVPEAKDADVVVEVRSAAFAIDREETVLGLPAIPLPLPGGGGIPQIVLASETDLTARAKFLLLARVRETGAHVASVGPLDGRSRHTRWTLLTATATETDVPEYETPRKPAPTPKRPPVVAEPPPRPDGVAPKPADEIAGPGA